MKANIKINITLGMLAVIYLLISYNKGMGNDEAIWHYIARVWHNNNLLPYTQTLENKTPGIYYLHYISYTLFGTNSFCIRYMAIAAILLSCHFIYRIAKHWQHQAAGLLAVCIYGLCMSWDAFDGPYLGQTETFMNLFNIMAFYFLLQSNANKLLPLFWAGCCMGMAIAFKQIAIVSVLGFMVIYSYCIAKSLKPKIKLQGLFLFITGLLVLTVISCIPLLISGLSFNNYWQGAWIILLHKGSGASLIVRAYFFIKAWLASRIVILYPCIAYMAYMQIKQKLKLPQALWLWLLFDVLATQMSGYYYWHQLKHFLPALAVLSSIALYNSFATAATPTVTTAKYRKLLLIVIAICFPYKEVIRNINEGLLHPISDPQKQMAQWINDHTTPNSPIYVLGNDANRVLCYSHCISASKYINSIFVATAAQQSEVLKDMKQQQPKYIVNPLFHYGVNGSDKLYTTLSKWLKPDPDATQNPNIGSNFYAMMNNNYHKVISMYEFDVYEHNE